jgi:hypothetical protein
MGEDVAVLSVVAGIVGYIGARTRILSNAKPHVLTREGQKQPACTIR